jgi:hypothetical protein
LIGQGQAFTCRATRIGGQGKNAKRGRGCVGISKTRRIGGC